MLTVILDWRPPTLAEVASNIAATCQDGDHWYFIRRTAADSYQILARKTGPMYDIEPIESIEPIGDATTLADAQELAGMHAFQRRTYSNGVPDQPVENVVSLRAVVEGDKQPSSFLERLHALYQALPQERVDTPRYDFDLDRWDCQRHGEHHRLWIWRDGELRATVSDCEEPHGVESYLIVVFEDGIVDGGGPDKGYQSIHLRGPRAVLDRLRALAPDVSLKVKV